MKKYKSIGKLLAVSFFTAVIASACTEDAMDKVNKNPNNPQDAPAKFLITDWGGRGAGGGGGHGGGGGVGGCGSGGGVPYH